MCGIIGLLSYYKCIKKIIEGLRQLQNRGYDSAGISGLSNSGYIVHKYASDSETALSKLDKIVNHYENFDNIIGHTRWATHGAKTDENSHPHLDMDQEFCIVHNGIIENYDIIKSKLKSKGFIFQSETDSEVISNLLKYYHTKKKFQTIEEVINKTISKLTGTYALLIQNVNQPDFLYCVRSGSPLIINVSEKEAIITSEISGFNNTISSYFILDNHDICTLKKENGKISMKNNCIYVLKNINLQNLDKTPHPYHYWMEKEIMEQAKSYKNVLNNGARIVGKIIKLGGLNENEEQLRSIQHLILLGCGTSLHASQLAKFHFFDLCNFESISVLDGADFGLHDIPKKGKSAAIFVSQSGETKDLHRCIQICNDNNIFTIGVINVVDSLIAREVNCGVYLNAGREVAVASTKVFISEVVALILIALWFSQLNKINDVKRFSYINELHKLEIQIQQVLNDLPKLKEFLPFFKHKNSCFILGKGRGYPIAAEGALKIKEVSYLHAESYSASSLKHGPFGLLEKDFPVVFVDPLAGDQIKVKNAYEEVISREAKVLTITDNRSLERKDSFYVPHNHHFGDLLCIIPLQYLSFLLALEKGLNPDYPRNLAKVVTVE